MTIGLLAQPEEPDLHAEAAYVADMLEDIRELAYASYSAQVRLARAVDDRPDSERAGVTLTQVVRNAIDAAVEGLTRADEDARSGAMGDDWTQSLNAAGSVFSAASTKRIHDMCTAVAQAGTAEIGGEPDGIDQAKS